MIRLADIREWIFLQKAKLWHYKRTGVWIG